MYFLKNCKIPLSSTLAISGFRSGDSEISFVIVTASSYTLVTCNPVNPRRYQWVAVMFFVFSFSRL